MGHNPMSCLLHRGLFAPANVLASMILLVTAGVCARAPPAKNGTEMLPTPGELRGGKFYRDIGDIRRKTCIMLNDIRLQRELDGKKGLIPENFNLKGVIVLLRHGDRGPLRLLRDTSKFSCGINLAGYPNAFPYYTQIVTNMKYENRKNSMFHTMKNKFRGDDESLLVPAESKCEKGMLTRYGILQHMKNGMELKSAYFSRLFPEGVVTKDQITVFSTKYKRTYQSGHAFLSRFLTPSDFYRVVDFKEAEVRFCFDYCTCESRKGYQRSYTRTLLEFYEKYPNIKKVVQDILTRLYDPKADEKTNEPSKIRDELVTWLCHNRFSHDDFREGDTIIQKIISLFNYVHEEAKFAIGNESQMKALMLGSYGFFKNIAEQIQRMISGDKPRFVLYSGHDETIKHISAAFGVLDAHTSFPPYASRFIVEVYSTNVLSTQKSYYFRLLFNGQDYTKKILFCKTSLERKNFVKDGFFACPVESIFRHLQESYFSIFKSYKRNFHDACRK